MFDTSLIEVLDNHYISIVVCRTTLATGSDREWETKSERKKKNISPLYAWWFAEMNNDRMKNNKQLKGFNNFFVHFQNGTNLSHF